MDGKHPRVAVGESATSVVSPDEATPGAVRSAPWTRPIRLGCDVDSMGWPCGTTNTHHPAIEAKLTAEPALFGRTRDGPTRMTVVIGPSGSAVIVVALLHACAIHNVAVAPGDAGRVARCERAATSAEFAEGPPCSRTTTTPVLATMLSLSAEIRAV